MIVLGIDVGLATTGFGLVDSSNGKLKYLDHGTILTSKFDDIPTRLLNIYNELGKIIQDKKPDLVGIEQLFYFRNTTTIITVGQARGVLLLKLKENELKIVEVTPLQVKQAVTSYGKSDKKQVQKMVKFLLGLDFVPQPDDAADALAIAICAININKNDFAYKR
jgi:crossover junction endodeoxyribonuclease RuvC